MYRPREWRRDKESIYYGSQMKQLQRSVRTGVPVPSVDTGKVLWAVSGTSRR